MAQPYFTRKAYFTNPKGIDFTEKKHRLSKTNGVSFLAEWVGFEPTVPLPVHLISSQRNYFGSKEK